MIFEKPVLTIDDELDTQSEQISTSNAETTSKYSEVWTSWLESNV